MLNIIVNLMMIMLDYKKSLKHYRRRRHKTKLYLLEAHKKRPIRLKKQNPRLPNPSLRLRLNLNKQIRKRETPSQLRKLNPRLQQK